MSHKKESVEINCSSCNTKFRLWIPIELLSGWGGGEEINCIKCGSHFVIKKSSAGIEVSPKKEEKAYAPSKTEAAEDKRSVLFVDDDKLAAAIAENTLADTNINLITVKSGEEAIARFKSNHIALIVTDLHLKDPNNPGTQLDGEDVLKMIADSGRGIPAIVTTGKEMIDDIIMDPKWFDLHVKGFVQKGNPFWAEELKTKIKEVLDIE